MLAYGMMLLAMLFLMFSIIGVQLFGGVLRQRCVDPSSGDVYARIFSDGSPYYCTLSSGWHTCPDSTMNATAGASAFTECRGDVGANPDGGVASFDNSLQASFFAP